MGRQSARFPTAEAEELGYEFANSPRDDLDEDPRERRHIGDVHVVTLKERAQMFLDGPGGITLETLNVLLSLILVAIAIVGSYEDDDEQVVKPSFSLFEIICMFFFLVDYALHLYASADRLRFVLSPIGIIDAITIIPTLITFFLVTLSVSALSMLRVARIFRMLAILRLYRIVKSYRGYDYQLAVLAFMIIALVLVAAGVFQVLEESYYSDQGLDPLEFHQAIYFVFVTVSTVGYGDISPKTAAGQFFVILVIIVVVTAVPRQINQLVELSKLQHGYMHSYSLRKRSIHYGGHVVVTGHLTPESIAEFLKEFYRPRQGRVNMDVVLLADQIPSDKIQALLLNVRYRRRTTYLKGSLLNDKDAKRAHIEKAAAVFILADKKAHSQRTEAIDALAVLQALAVDKFRFRMQLQESNDNFERHRPPPRMRCFLEILSPQRTRGLRTITGVEVALNTPRLRTAILARTIACPGATALLLNLIYSASEHHVKHGKASNIPWIAEYASGLQHLMFPVYLPYCFGGLSYAFVAGKLYEHFHVILIGLYDESAATQGRRRIQLSPFGQKLRAHSIAFLIAPSASAAKTAIDSLEHQLHPPAIHLRRRWSVARAMGAKPIQVQAPAPSQSTLVFSSDTVLSRQSFIHARSHSIRLEDDDVSVPPSDDDINTSDADEESVHSVGAFTLTHIIPADSFPTKSSGASSTLPTHKITRIHSESFLGSSTRPKFSRQQTVPALRRSESSFNRGTRKRLSDHIIICGPLAQSHHLACYLDALFAHETPAESECPTIVLLVKTLPSDDELAETFERALPPTCVLEKGVSQNVEDLLRVRAYDARAVLFVPGSWKYAVDELSVDENVDDHLLDYQVIMSTLSLQTIQELHREHQLERYAVQNQSEVKLPIVSPVMCSSVVRSRDSIKYFAYKISKEDHAHHEQASLELLQRQGSFIRRREAAHDHHRHEHHDHGAFSFFGLHAKSDHHHHEMSALEAELLLPAEFAPAYAAGEVFVDSILDTLLCQSFFNPYVIDLVRALAGDYYFEHGSAPSTAPAGSFQQFVATAAARQESSVCLDISDGDLFPHAVLSIATVAPELNGESFEHVFHRALAQDVLLLAIYRHADDAKRGNARPYVFTCPDDSGDFSIERGDRLHALSRRRPPLVIH